MLKRIVKCTHLVYVAPVFAMIVQPLPYGVHDDFIALTKDKQKKKKTADMCVCVRNSSREHTSV